jgi:hypothetical protein
MTLIITIVSQEGIWQSSDHCLYNQESDQPLQIESQKHIVFECPDGRGLLAYAGLGLYNNIQMSDWVCEILRGETRNLENSLNYLCVKSSTILGPYLERGNIPHSFAIGAFQQSKPYLFRIENFYKKGNKIVLPVQSKFHILKEQIEGSKVEFTGMYTALSKRQREKLVNRASQKPKKPEDFLALLSNFNEIAHHGCSKLISASCRISFMPPDGRPFTSVEQPRNGIPIIYDLPILLLGIDIKEMIKPFYNEIRTARDINDNLDINNLQKIMDDAGRKSVSPRDRLHPISIIRKSKPL